MMEPPPAPPCLFRIRTVTAFVTLLSQDFPTHTEVQAVDEDEVPWCRLTNKISLASKLLQRAQAHLTKAGYEVQTLRIATNPFGEWIFDPSKEAVFQPAVIQTRLRLLNLLLNQNGITFLSVGPAQTLDEIPICVKIVKTCPYVSCSATVQAGDVATAKATAKCIQQIALLPDMGGLGNFRFCAAAGTCPPGIPFFPVAKAISMNDVAEGGNGLVGFALGLENGRLAQHWLQQAGSIAEIPTVFKEGMADALIPVQDICQDIAKQYQYNYLGMDTSLNPSLDSDNGGSVAVAIEKLAEISCFGGTGTVGVAAAITTALQSLPNIQLTGYCGLMLPVCEDHRLAELAAADADKLRIADLLSVSSVCGVGIDTVPLPGNVSKERLTSLILDVAGLAARWNKPLSCRVLPFDGKVAGEPTTFDSPYMVNTTIMELEGSGSLLNSNNDNGKIDTMSPPSVVRMEQEIQVKIQSLSCPVATTHKFSLSDLLDSKGSPSLNQLQDAILRLVGVTTEESFTDSTLDKLSLSYLDAQGDLVPLTSQDEWNLAIQQRQAKSNSAHKSRTLLVFAQVLQQNNVSSPSTATGGSNSNTSPQLEDRLAQIEKLLLSVANNQSNNLSSEPESPARCRDYKTLVKEQEARIQNRLNKVKTMNRVSSAPSTPTRIRSHSPTPSTGMGTMATAPALPLPGTNGDALQDFLQRIVQERQEGMQQLMDARVNEMKEWGQAQKDMKATIQQAMAEMETKIDAKLEAKLSAHNLQFQQNIRQFEQQTANAASPPESTASTTTAVASSITSLERKLDNVQERLDGIEKYILRQPTTRPSAAASSDSEGASTRDIAEQLQTFKIQIKNKNANVVKQVETFKNQIKNLFLVQMTGMEQRLGSMAASNRHVMNEQLDGFKNQIKNLLLTRMAGLERRLNVVASSCQYSNSNSPTAEVDSSSGHQEALLKAFQTKVDTLIQTRFNLLEQRLLQQNFATPSSSLTNASSGVSSSRSPTSTINDSNLQQQVDVLKAPSLPGKSTASPTTAPKDVSSVSASSSSSNGDGNLPEMTKTVTALVKQLMETFQQKLKALDAKLSDTVVQSHQQIQSTQDKAFQELIKRAETSQATILKNQKQYASALRQTIVRLHDETRTHMSSATKMNGSNERALKNSSSRGLSPLPSDGLSATTSWDTIKELILSSHEELRESHQRSIEEQKSYLVECIELSQHAVLAKLTSNTVSESALDESVSEAEQRLSTLVEQIQAQATAAILDRLDQQALLASKHRWRRLAPEESVLVADQSTGGSDAVSPVSPLASADNMVATAASPSPSGTLSAGITAEDMEDLLLSAMEKLEVAMEANCEQIQAQATAVILDRVETCQNTIVSKAEGSQVVLLDKVVRVEGLTSGKLDAALALLRGLDKLARNGKLDSTLDLVQGLQKRMDERPPSFPKVAPQPTAHQPLHAVPRSFSPPRQATSRLSTSSGMDGSHYSHFSASNYNRNGGESKYGREDFHGGGARRSQAPETMAYQRFVELETRSQKLERAYKVIRFNNPPEAAESSDTPMADEPVAECWEEEEKEEEDVFPSLQNRSSAAARWLNSHPVSSMEDTSAVNSSFGYSA